jgi:hypothetical protein
MFAWRNYLEVHPAADDYPLLKDSDPAAFRELVEDIRKHGLRANIVLWEDNDGKRLLDGRNRLDALAELGVLYDDIDARLGLKSWTGTKWAQLSGNKIQFQHLAGGDPYALAASLNVHRRHLTAELKRDLIAKLLKARPDASSNSIGKQVKAGNKTVDAVRRKLEANWEIPNKTDRTEADGRKARGRKPATKQPKTEKHKPAPKVPGLPTDTGPTADQQRAADLKQVFSDAVLALLGLTSRPSAQFADIVAPSSVTTVANFLNQIAALKPDDAAAASAEAMKAKHAAADPALIPDDLSIPPSLRRTA